MLGALGTVLGYLGSAFAPHVTVAYIGFGMFSGIGAGLVYATCVNMVGKWYPERKGGKTGLVNGGFAYGSVPFVFLFTSYMDLGRLAQGVLVTVGLRSLCAVVAFAGWFFKDPPKGWWPPHVDPLKVSDDPRIRRALEKNPPAVEAEKEEDTPQGGRPYARSLDDVVLSAVAGINIFGIAFQVPFGKDMGFAGGIVATAMSLKAIVNGTGRGVIGWISDRFGRRNTLIIVCLVLGSASWGAGLRSDGQHAVLPVLLHGLRLRRRGDLPAVRGHDGGLLRREQQRVQLRNGLQLEADLGPWWAPAWARSSSARGTTTGPSCSRAPSASASAVLALVLKSPGRPKARSIVPTRNRSARRWRDMTTEPIATQGASAAADGSNRSYHEVTDARGRVYRIGEDSDRDILGHSRKFMVYLPWIAMMAISVFEYAYGSAEDTLSHAHGWDRATPSGY